MRAAAVGLRDCWRVLTLVRQSHALRERMARPDLTYLFWEATRRCNLRCVHCGSGCEAASPFAELTTDQIKAIVATIAEDFDARRIFVAITGGEPMLRADLVEVVGYLSSLGMSPSMVTNGTLLGADEAARLREAGMRAVAVSVDGLEKEHEAMRGRGTFLPAVRALGHARQAGIELVEAITCVRPDNLEQLRQVEDCVREAGATHWRLLTIDRMGRGVTREARLWLDGAQVKRLLDFVAERRPVFLKSGEFDVSYSCGGFVGARRDAQVRESGGCHAGLSIGSILCDGGVSACPSLPRDWIQGSALDTRFSELWRTRFTKHRSLEWRKEGPCADCSWFGVCMGGGLHERAVQPEEFCWLDRLDSAEAR